MGRLYRTWRESRGKRLPAEAYAAAAPVHVTLSTKNRKAWFACADLAVLVFEPVHDHPETLAACLMPDHLHWLLSNAATMSRTVGAMKSWTTRRFWERGIDVPVWQRSYYDRVVRSHEDLVEIARYLVANPVRAGLVERVDAYPFQVIYEDRLGA